MWMQATGFLLLALYPLRTLIPTLISQHSVQITGMHPSGSQGCSQSAQCLLGRMWKNVKPSNKGILGLETISWWPLPDALEHAELCVSASLLSSKHSTRSIPFTNVGVLGLFKTLEILKIYCKGKTKERKRVCLFFLFFLSKALFCYYFQFIFYIFILCNFISWSCNICKI